MMKFPSLALRPGAQPFAIAAWHSAAPAHSTLRPLALASVISLCAGLAAQAQAQQGQQPTAQALEEVVVTATRTEQPLSDLVADVSIIDRDTIEKSGATGVADVLARLPGIELARNGGIGTSTSLYIRGAEARYTAVFIDGVRLDSQATGGATWESIPLALIDRIEVVRGAAAAVYGSDAVAGVVQIFTRKGEAGIHPYVSVGLGNQGTRDVSAGISGAQGLWDYAISAAYEESDGFNVLNNPNAWGYNPDKDGYDRRSFQARVGLQVHRQHRLEGSWLGSRLDSGYDSSATEDDRNKHRMQALNLGLHSEWSERYRTRLSVGDSRSRYETTPSVYLTETNVRSYLFHNEYRVGIHQFTAALERREDQLENTPIDRDHHQNALALGYGLRAGAHTVQANVRRDDDSEFGGNSTGSLAYAFAFTPQWRASASVGTAFRAPTLYQRFSDSGNASLKPETSRNVELGLRWAQGSNSLGVTAYQNRVKNQITYVSGAGGCASSWGCYENLDKARYKGVTLEGTLYAAGVQWRGSMDFQKPENQTTGLLLARRAKRHATFGADAHLAGWDLGAEVQASGRRWSDPANTQLLGGYTLFNLYASRNLGHDLSLTARVDNVGDKNYEFARNYATAGRTFHVGLKWAPQ